MTIIEKKDWYDARDIQGYLGINRDAQRALERSLSLVRRMVKDQSNRTRLCITIKQLEKMMVQLGYVRITYKGNDAWAWGKKIKRFKSF